MTIFVSIHFAQAKKLQIERVMNQISTDMNTNVLISQTLEILNIISFLFNVSASLCVHTVVNNAFHI